MLHLSSLKIPLPVQKIFKKAEKDIYEPDVSDVIQR